jgi:hypothetical protein
MVRAIVISSGVMPCTLDDSGRMLRIDFDFELIKHERTEGPARATGVLHPSYQAPSLTAGEGCRMTELLIGTVSWLATFGFIAAAIAEMFR